MIITLSSLTMKRFLVVQNAKNSPVTNVLITSVKDVIYHKRKTGSKMCITDVKRCLLKNLSILKTKELIANNM